MSLSGLFLLGIFLTFFLLAAQLGAPGRLVVASTVTLSLALLVGMAGFHTLQNEKSFMRRSEASLTSLVD